MTIYATLTEHDRAVGLTGSGGASPGIRGVELHYLHAPAELGEVARESARDEGLARSRRSLKDDLPLVFEQPQNHELEIALVEHSGAAERAAPRLAASAPERPCIKPEILGAHPERPREPLTAAIASVHR